jgi:hypothetical protein
LVIRFIELAATSNNYSVVSYKTTEDTPVVLSLLDFITLRPLPHRKCHSSVAVFMSSCSVRGSYLATGLCRQLTPLTCSRKLLALCEGTVASVVDEKIPKTGSVPFQDVSRSHNVKSKIGYRAGFKHYQSQPRVCVQLSR